MSLAVIIITHNNQKTISKCLASVLENFSLLENNRNQIFILDSASADQTVPEIEKIKQKTEPGNPKITLLKSAANSGFAKGVNQLLKIAKKQRSPDFFFLLNPDAWLQKNCLKNLLSTASQTAISSAQIIDVKTQKPYFLATRINWLRMRALHLRNQNKAKKINKKIRRIIRQNFDYLPATALLVPRKIIEKVGFFDERFFLYYEDADFSLRLKKAGFDLNLNPESTCFHLESQSSDSETKTYHLVKNGLLFFHKYYPRPFRFYFWLVFYLRLFWHQNISRKKIVLKALRDFQNSLPSFGKGGD